jgi:hypothetical protein
VAWVSSSRSSRVQTPLPRFFQAPKPSMRVARARDPALAGTARGSLTVTSVVPSGFGPLSTRSPSPSLEWATLPSNWRRRVRRGQTRVVRDSPVGCSGKATQNPIPSLATATLPRRVLSGLVTQ